MSTARLPESTWEGTHHTVRITHVSDGEGLESLQIHETQMYMLVAWQQDLPVSVTILLEKPHPTVGGFLAVVSEMLTDSLIRGVSVEELQERFRGYRFEPSGATSNPAIPRTTSPVDYVVRWLLNAKMARFDSKNLASISKSETLQNLPSPPKGDRP